MMDFKEFGKIARLSRECTVTEKIDGTNGLIAFDENMNMQVGSRSRWITPQDDNHGFAKWAYEHADDLKSLGVGYHYGEWWGQGIHRRYDMAVKLFSLFNTHRWADCTGIDIATRPACCRCVPILYTGIFDTHEIKNALNKLVCEGSVAAPGFMKPEGVVIYHSASRCYYKKTIDKDEGKTV